MESEAFFDRLLRSVGSDSLRKLGACHVVVCLRNGVGVELAKNLVLLGFGRVTLLSAAVVSARDLGSNCFLSREDVGNPLVCAKLTDSLRALNPWVCVDSLTLSAAATRKPLADCINDAVAELHSRKRVSAVALCGFGLATVSQVDGHWLPRGVHVVVCDAPGLFGAVLVDLAAVSGAPQFVSLDATGEELHSGFVNHIYKSTAKPKGGEALLRWEGTVVSVGAEHRHLLSDGDWLQLRDVRGMADLNAAGRLGPVRVLTPFSFSLPFDSSALGDYLGGGVWTQLRVPQSFDFQPLARLFAADATTKKGVELATDSAAHKTVDAVMSLSPIADVSALIQSSTGQPLLDHLFYSALSVLRAQHSDDDSDVLCIAERLAASCEQFAALSALSEAQKQAICQLGLRSDGCLAPMCSIVGGIAALELLKCCAQKFTPIRQVLYANYAMSAAALGSSSETRFAERYADYALCFGDEALQRLFDARVFVVGAGAVGCELLKNLALMGAGVGCAAASAKAKSKVKTAGISEEKAADSHVGDDGVGGIVVTDMATIAVSDLSRQWLFGAADVGLAKATVAAKRLRQMNGDLRLFSQTTEVCKAADAQLTAAFWRTLAVAFTALHSSASRLFVDQKCVNYKVPQVDGGSLNAKLSCTVSVPFATESYSSQRELARMRSPATGPLNVERREDSFQICTVRNFPNRIEHCVQWALEEFETIFVTSALLVNDYCAGRCLLPLESASDGDDERHTLSVDECETLASRLVTYKPLSFAHCVWFARFKFEEMFANEITQLTYSFPADHRTADGSLFWKGCKLLPTAMRFDIDNELHLQFVASCAQLYARMFALTAPMESESASDGHVSAAMRRAVGEALAAMRELAAFAPDTGRKIATTDAELETTAATATVSDSGKLEALCSALPTPASVSGFTLKVTTPKPCESQPLALWFVHCAANLRAQNYGIDKAAMFATKGLALRLAPAIAAMSATVGGLMAMEWLKLAAFFDGGKAPGCEPLPYRNCFANLAKGCLLQTEVAKCKVQEIEFVDVNSRKRKTVRTSLWDNICVEHCRTLSDVVDFFERDFGCEVGMVSFGAAILYAFFHSKAKRQKRLKAPLRKVLEAVTKKKLADDVSELYLEVALTDADDNDVDVPTVRVVLH